MNNHTSQFAISLDPRTSYSCKVSIAPKTFLLSTLEYKTKAPGVSPQAEKQHTDELERLKRIYGGGDLSKFPKFNFEEK